MPILVLINDSNHQLLPLFFSATPFFATIGLKIFCFTTFFSSVSFETVGNCHSNDEEDNGNHRKGNLGDLCLDPIQKN